MPIQSKNPATEEILRTFEEISDATLEQKIKNAEKAFTEWKNTTFKERAALMRKLAVYLRENQESLADIQTREMGKTKKSGIPNIEKCALLCEYYADNAETMLNKEMIEGVDTNNHVRFDPLGIVLAVMPWNFPYWQVYRFAIPALMAGNVGLLKHASNVPQCAEAIEASFRTVGFPEGVFQNLLLPSARVEKLIRDPRVAAVTLTGSEKAGSEVAKVAGEEIKKTVLELGGSDPFVVFADADIKKAAQTAVTARMQGNVGQSCISAKRFIVESSVAEEFTQHVTTLCESLKIGDPTDANTDIGPLATEQIFKEISSQVVHSIELGAVCVTGGSKAPVQKGYYYPPTVLTAVTKHMPVWNEETFGPVLPIMTFDTEAQAIELANDTRYGLGATLFTQDEKRIVRLITQIEAGSIAINDLMKSDQTLPFGGIKKSGYGRELAEYGIKEFVNVKSIQSGK